MCVLIVYEQLHAHESSKMPPPFDPKKLPGVFLFVDREFIVLGLGDSSAEFWLTQMKVLTSVSVPMLTQ